MTGTRYAMGLVALAMGALMHLPAGAAEDVVHPVAVVELFTSQGCGSCPKADAKLAELAERGDVVTLAYHVDYWDYLGWKDTLARAENTSRQQDYARIFGNRSVYTPQVVMNGTQDIKGSKPMRIDAALRRMEMAGSLPVEVDLDRTDDSLVISIGEGEARGEAAILLVYFREHVEVDVTQGKNRGRRMSHVHAVSAFHGAGMWEGKAQELRMPLHEVQKKGRGGLAVIVQEIDADGMPGAIRGAAMIHHRPGV